MRFSRPQRKSQSRSLGSDKLRVQANIGRLYWSISESSKMVIATESDQPGDVGLVYDGDEDADKDEFKSPGYEERK